MPLSKWIDIPPVWLLGAVALVWLETLVTGGLNTGNWGLWAGRFLIVAGLGLMVAAIWEFQKAKTSPVPHMQPSAMITSGIFGITRNPIYLGDALILLGLGFGLGAISTLIVLPLFVALIHLRFIRAEEKRLEAGFPETWPRYRSKVRRWI